jgi:hypothetical protein
MATAMTGTRLGSVDIAFMMISFEQLRFRRSPAQSQHISRDHNGRRAALDEDR